MIPKCCRGCVLVTSGRVCVRAKQQAPLQVGGQQWVNGSSGGRGAARQKLGIRGRMERRVRGRARQLSMTGRRGEGCGEVALVVLAGQVCSRMN
jgi:hypothetical protein